MGDTIHRHQAYMIRAFWDADASVWVASSDDIPGLVTEADTTELLVTKLKVLIPDLLEANGILPKAYDSVPFHLHSEMNDVAAVRTHWLANLARQLKKLLSENGCRFERHGKGDHDIWITDRRFPVDQGVKSRHTANGVLKQAGLPKAF